MKSTTPENEHYRAVLADLKAKRDQLNHGIAAIEQIMNGGSITTVAAPVGAAPHHGSPEIRSDTFYGLNIADATKKLLDMRHQPLKAKEISESLIEGGVSFTTDNPANTVASVLSRFLAQGDGSIVKIGRGSFALAKWYPNGKQ